MTLKFFLEKILPTPITKFTVFRPFSGEILEDIPVHDYQDEIYSDWLKKEISSAYLSKVRNIMFFIIEN